MKHPYLFLAVALSLSSCDKAAPPAIKPAPATVVQAVHPEHGDIQRWLTRPAQVRPFQQAVLYAKVAGYVKNIAVEEGDHVEAGAVLAELEVPELQADMLKYHAELDAARLDSERLNAAFKKSPDLITPQSVDTANAKFLVAQASLQRNGVMLGFAKIVAPFEGVVTHRWVDAGAFVPAATGSSMAQGAAVVTLMDFSTVRLDIAIPEPEVPFVKNGLPVVFNSDSLPGRTFSGNITRFSNTLDDSTRTMHVEVDLPNPDRSLRPGMFLQARLALEAKSGALLIPSDALVVEKTKTSVFLAVSGTAKKTAVKAGFNDGTHVEILDGVKPTDFVILTAKLTLADGQAVTISEAK